MSADVRTQAGADGPLYAKLKPGPGRSRTEVDANQKARLYGAMIELVTEHGYEAVTVRGLAGLAGVSKGTPYRHFDNTEECFAATFDHIVDCAVKRLGGMPDEGDPAVRIRSVLRVLMDQIAAHPKAAHLALVDVFAAGPAMLPRYSTALTRFEEFLCLADSPADRRWLELQGTLTRGVIAAVARVARARLLAGRPEHLSAIADELADWTISLGDPRAAELLDLAAALPVARARAVKAVPAVPANDGWLGSIDPEHSRILYAVAKLGATDGYWSLTVPRIRAEAQVSRRTFDSRFHDARDCYVEAAEALTKHAAAQAERAARDEPTWERGVYRTALALCLEIVRDPVVARLGFKDVFAPGRDGLTCREHLVSVGADRLRRIAPLDSRPSELFAEASMAAAWRLTYDEIAAGRTNRLPSLAPVISYLILAPAIGAPAALEVIRSEHRALRSRRQERVLA